MCMYDYVYVWLYIPPPCRRAQKTVSHLPHLSPPKKHTVFLNSHHAEEHKRLSHTLHTSFTPKSILSFKPSPCRRTQQTFSHPPHLPPPLKHTFFLFSFPAPKWMGLRCKGLWKRIRNDSMSCGRSCCSTLEFPRKTSKCSPISSVSTFSARLVPRVGLRR